MTAPETHGSWVTWVMGQELNGSLGSWVTLSDPFRALLGSFFSFINNRLKSNIASVGLKMDDETITTDPSMKAEILNKFFWKCIHGR